MLADANEHCIDRTMFHLHCTAALPPARPASFLVLGATSFLVLRGRLLPTTASVHLLGLVGIDSAEALAVEDS